MLAFSQLSTDKPSTQQALPPMTTTAAKRVRQTKRDGPTTETCDGYIDPDTLSSKDLEVIEENLGLS